MTSADPNETSSNQALANNLQSILEQQTHIIQSQSWHGPLPDPESFRKYEEIYPGSAKIIMNQLVKQTEHRHDIEKKIISHKQANARLGQIFAFILSLAIIIVAFIDVYLGGSNASIIIPALVTGGVIAVIRGDIFDRQERKSRQDKNK